MAPRLFPLPPVPRCDELEDHRSTLSCDQKATVEIQDLCYGEDPLFVLGDVAIWICGAVVRLYSGERELPGHLDQGDLIRERSIGVGVMVAFPDGGSYPRVSLYHGLHGVEPIGEYLVKVVGLRILGLFSRRCVSSRCRSWEVLACLGVGFFQGRHRASLSSESTLLVTCRIKGLVLISEGKILRFELAELLGALIQLLGAFVELFLQDLELRGKLWIGVGTEIRTVDFRLN
ncbi:hypothetical protein DY000_02031416 [Brassica cretica]|uniref:Uncharacterized protein n=1 Tax=Brassica cretica TaxID=69181 RepID=A0ABQ7DH16_BRACR|nr:hypothetical protein DY000_02031416 [Brassica cretica]